MIVSKEAGERDTAGQPKSTRKRDVVLVVDDTPDSLSMINDTLDRAGLTVLVALDGQQALTIANSITPDIILLDALMPGIDGFSTCRELKGNARLKHIPVIFMTGLSDTEHIVQGFEAGGVDYITKPVNSDELIARMRVHLANARLTQSARGALDAAGQFLFAANKQGTLQWATPQAYQLLSTNHFDEAWLKDQLPIKLQPFLSANTDKGRGLIIEQSINLLKIHYIGLAAEDEYLLQLEDMKKPSELTRLNKALPLTERETEVLLWIARGKTNREIGIILNISPRTANKHLEQIFRKLGVENRTAAAIIALQHLQ